MKIEESTDIIAQILYRSGVRHAVVSSGSRSLRMVRAVADNANIEVRMIVDERVAAFSAIGISDCTSRPVALICTSGSAMLNYSPAVAEAYYRGIPLIVITADRPADVIDINDGQTIRQFHALDNIAKASIDIDATTPCSEADFDEINRVISIAMSPRKGPVHINLHLEEGYGFIKDESTGYEKAAVTPDVIRRHEYLSASELSGLSRKKILIFLGQMHPDRDISKSVRQLAGHDNIVVVAEAVSNCSGGNIIDDIESIIGRVKDYPEIFNPEIVITLGKTSPVSRRFKEWLRNIGDYRHWRVNDRKEPEDTYYHLDKTIVAGDDMFLKYLTDNLPAAEISYSQPWLNLKADAQTIKKTLISNSPWSDISAIDTILEHLPEGYNIQCSNGMSIRYLSLIGTAGHPLYCNRGVNGIDGSTSTALGFSSVAEAPTLLITGDMSALYDISALYSGQLSPAFKMVIMANKGGEIFRMVPATRDYENREEMLCHMPDIKWENVARSVDMEYYEASDNGILCRVLPRFFCDSTRASLLVINTPAGNSRIYSDIIKEIYNKS